MARQALVARKTAVILAAMLVALSLLVGAGGSNAVITSAPADRPFCLSDELLSRSLRRNPALKKKLEQQERRIRDYIESRSAKQLQQLSATSVFIIPVVVYVVHDGGPIGSGENISEEQVHSQLAALNNEFSDHGIKFCLATKEDGTTLSGSPTPGIIRIQSPLTDHLTAEESSLKALSTLPADRYLRIWVVKDIDHHSGVVGYARFPGTASPSLEGIVMRYDVFGDAMTCGCSNLLPTYDRGKILAHEVGHYLNLFHPFHGDCSGVAPNDCAALGDRVCDTPQIADASTGCPGSPVTSCDGTPALIDNHMDYTNDLCRDAFTQGQEERMLATLQTVRQQLSSPDNLAFTGVECAGLLDASFSADNFNPCTDRSVTFDALNISGAAYEWNFGDGGTGSGELATHTYTNAGTYPVTLTVTSGGTSVSNTRQVFVTACTPISSSQGNWYFGQRAGLNFSTGAPVADLSSAMNADEACVTQSTPAGELLFYSDGVNVYDKKHSLMNPANPLLGNKDYTQGAISVPDPAHPDRYYLFLLSGAGQDARLRYTVVDFADPSFPDGTLIDANTPVSPPGVVLTEHLTAIPNCSGTGYWVIVQGHFENRNNFYVVAVTANGVSAPVSYAVAAPGYFGSLKASPDGRMLAQASLDILSNPIAIAAAVYNFDNATGEITLRNVLPKGGVGCSFSPDSRLLYTAGDFPPLSGGSTIYQYDLSAADPAATVAVVADNLPTQFSYIALQLGPDKKIYGSPAIAQSFLYVINYPNRRNTPGAPNACGFSFLGPSLCLLQTCRKTTLGLPNMIDALPPEQVPVDFSYVISSCSTVEFSAPSCATYAWDFGDGTTSTEQNPAHTYAADGVYTVTLTLNGSTTVSHPVTIGLPASATAIACPSQVCLASGNPPFYNYSVNAQPGLLYKWEVSGGVISGASDRDNIDVAWSTLPGTVQLTVTDPATGCTATRTLTVPQNCGGANPGAGTVVISEFRLFGPNGPNDEFVELFNNSGADLLVNASDASTGWAVASSDGKTLFVIPNGTIIPACSHYLAVNGVGYSLGSYAVGDATYSTDIPPNVGIALFNTATPSNFNTTTRLDAVGPATLPTGSTYMEGAGYPPLSVLPAEHSLYRDLKSGKPKDTNNNEADFLLVSTNAASLCTPTCIFACERLGAPGPENLSSPSPCTMQSSLIAPCVAAAAPPNRVRLGSGNAGTLSIRRKFTNPGPGIVTRLRFRIVDITTLPAPNRSTAVLTATTSPTSTEAQVCGGGSITIEGLTLEIPPMQGLGGGFNSTLSAGTVTLTTPLAAGESINVNFLLNIMQAGYFRFYVIVEDSP